MTRSMMFEGEKGMARFAMLYEMWLTGAAVQQGRLVEGQPNQRVRDLAQMRAERRVTQALRAMSVEVPPARPNEAPLRALPSTPAVLSLPQDSHALLLKYLEVAAPVMPIVRADDALDVLDAVEAADKLDG